MFEFISFLIMLGLGFAVGGARNRRHLQELDMEERMYREIPITTGVEMYGHKNLNNAQLVTGGTVISVDYFKRLFAILRVITGGRLTSYESLLERGRREALLRMKKDARRKGASGVINVRIETTRIANGRGDKQLAGIEVLAYGTGVNIH